MTYLKVCKIFTHFIVVITLINYSTCQGQDTAPAIDISKPPVCAPNTWCIPKCCDIDKTFLVPFFECAKIRQWESPSWAPTIYKSPEYPRHKMDKISGRIGFHVAGIHENCNKMSFHNVTQHLQVYFTVPVTIGNITQVKDNVKLVAPSNERDGIVRAIQFRKGSRKWRLIQNPTTFCVDRFHIQHDEGLTVYSENGDEFVMLVCQHLATKLKARDDGSFSNWEFWVIPIVGILGSAFFLATLVIYGVNWKKLNLHGLLVLNFNAAALGNYFCYILLPCIAVLFVAFGIISINGFLSLCYGTAVLSHYFTFVSYLWLVVMSYDLWRVFNSVQAVKRDCKQWKKFSLYFLATWIFAFVIIMVFVTIDQVYKDPITEIPVPGYAAVPFYRFVSPYFIGYYVAIPILLLIGINIVFILLTARVFMKARSNNTRLAEAMSKANKYSYKLLLRLFIIMGLGANMLDLVSMLLFVYIKDEDVEHFIEGIVLPWPVSVIIYLVCLMAPIYCFSLFCLNDRVINQLRDKHPKFADKLDYLRTLLSCAKKGRRDSEANNDTREVPVNST